MYIYIYIYSFLLLSFMLYIYIHTLHVVSFSHFLFPTDFSWSPSKVAMPPSMTLAALAPQAIAIIRSRAVSHCTSHPFTQPRKSTKGSQCVRKCVYIYTYGTCFLVHVYIYMCVYIYICIHIYIHIYTDRYTRIHVYT